MTQDEINAVKKAAEKMRKQESAQDEIIEMAKKAGFFVKDREAYSPSTQEDHEITFFLRTFANLVAAKVINSTWTQEQWTEYEKAIAAIKEEALAQEQEPVACKTLCELCVKRGYTFCVNATKTTPITTPPQPEQEPSGHFLDFAYSDSIAYVHVYDQFRKGQQFYKDPPQRTEQNFCPRCGKRLGGIDSIHTCTPPRENT